MVSQYADIIILLFVIILIFSKLKTLLGTRPDEAPRAKISDKEAEKILDILSQEIKNHKTNFTWSLGGGVGILITRHTNLDLGYRYLNMGRIKAEDGTKYEITNQEYYIGLRYTF